MKQSKALNHLRTINQLNNYEPYLQLKAQNKALYEALKAVQSMPRSHNGHWDSFGTGGANCPVCMEQSVVMDKVDKAIKDYEVSKVVKDG
jgi:hypothetical protein